MLSQFNRLVEEEMKKSTNIEKTAKVSGKEETVLSPELKIRHKESGILYTVVSVGVDDVVLKTPEGQRMLIDTDTLEAEYSLS